LGFWTFLVALGVALEVIFVIWEYLEELHDFRRGIIHPPERPRTLLFVMGLLGAGLVAAGVSGEYQKESQIATVETCIRAGNNALFLHLSKEAGDAQTSAKNAHDEADAATEASRHAFGKSNAANEAAGSAKEKARDVEKRAEDLQNKYAEAERELQTERERRIELEKTVTPRLISRIVVRGCSSNIDALKQFKGTSVRIVGITDWEARRAAKNLVGIFKNAHWSLEGDGASAVEQELPDGVSVEAYMPSEADNDSAGISREWEAEDVAETVVDFLEANGWQATFRYSQRGELKPDEIKILVGFKPAPYFSPSKAPQLSARAKKIQAQIEDLQKDSASSSWSPNMLMEPTKANNCPK
jgi:hypothetical protein